MTFSSHEGMKYFTIAIMVEKNIRLLEKDLEKNNIDQTIYNELKTQLGEGIENNIEELEKLFSTLSGAKGIMK